MSFYEIPTQFLNIAPLFFYQIKSVRAYVCFFKVEIILFHELYRRKSRSRDIPLTSYPPGKVLSTVARNEPQ